MKYAAGENVMSCIQSAECDKATKLGVTERSEDELRREAMLPTFTSAWMLTVESMRETLKPVIKNFIDS